MVVVLLPSAAIAAPSLSIVPITWNVIGLDSNAPATQGPDTFASGARVCNTGDATATNVVSTFVWDSSNSYINTTGLTSLSVASLAASVCTDFYYNIVVTRNSAAFDTSRSYHITATADGLGASSTPTPRELHVEHLVSQNRNSVNSISGPTTVYVGGTYTFVLNSGTAPGGYEQLSSFLNFPNSIFQILSVSSTYTQPPGATNTTIYGDACGWDTVPTSPTYRSCIGPQNYSGGKVGGTVVTTYTVNVISVGTATMTGMVYDFSGSSFHYNSDYGIGVNAITVTASAQTDLSITKTDSVDPVVAGTDLTYTIGVSNNGPADATGVVVSDPVPAGTSFVSATGGGTESGGAVTWNLGNLANGASSSFTVTVHVLPGRTSGLSNTATVSSSTTDPTPGNDSATQTTTVGTSADVSITKADSPDPVGAGQDLTYTLNVANAGPSDAQSVSVTDNLPAGVTFVSATPSQGSCSQAAGVITCNLGTVAASAAPSISVLVRPTTAGSITNTATVSSSTSDPDGSNNSASAGTTVQPRADLSITKTDSSDPVVAGTDLTYTIGVSNNGPSDATGVAVSDPIPAGTSFVSATGGGTFSAGTVTWNIGNLANGASSSFTVTVHVLPGRTSGLSNTATVSFSTTDPSPGNDSATQTTSVGKSADVSVNLADAPDPVGVGGNVTYTLDVANAGPSDAQSVSLTDTLPAGVTFVSADNGGTESGGIITWDLGTLPAGGSTTLTVVITTTSVGTITDQADVSSSTLDPDGSNNSVSTDTNVQAGPAQADLSVSITDAPDPVPVGQDVTYTLTVTNTGPDDAVAASLTDTLPAGVTFVSASPGCTETLGVVPCDLGTITSGGIVVVTMTVTTTTVGSITDQASVSSTTVDPDNSNNAATQDTTVVASAVPSVDVSIANDDAPDPASVGGTLTYTLTVANVGPDAATAVVVTDVLPADVTYVSATLSQGTCVETAGTVTCDLGGIASGGRVSISLVVTPMVAGSITDTASVSAAETDTDPTNNAATAVTTVPVPAAAADLSITKTASPDPASVGQSLTYTLTVTNNGPDAATGVVASDPLPSSLAFVSAAPSQGTCSVAGETVTCLLGDVASGGSTAVSIVTTASAAGTATNTASVQADQSDPDLSNNAVSVDTPVQGSADLSLTKTAAASVDAGSDLTYTLIVSNAGPSDALDVIVTDPLPAGEMFVSADNGGTESAGTVSWNLGVLPVGGSMTLTLVATVGSDVVTDVSNTASVTSSTLDPNPVDDSANAATVVRPASSADPLDLAVTNKVDDELPAEGDTVTFTVTITNKGSDDATGVVVSDPLPQGLSFISAKGDGSYDATTGDWAVGKLPFTASRKASSRAPASASKATLTLKAKVTTGTAGKDIAVTASLAAVDQTDTVSSNNSQVVVLSITAVQADLAFTGGVFGRMFLALILCLLAGVALLLAGARRREDRPQRRSGNARPA